MRPILELSTREDITRQTATEAMIEICKLSEEERNSKLKAGGLVIKNRTGWAMTYLTKAKLIEKVAKFTYRATSQGVDYLACHQGSFTNKDLEKIEGFLDAWGQGSKKGEDKPDDKGDSSTPDERIEEAFSELHDSVSDEIREKMATMNPYKFEQLVVDLLFAMGYGGSREEAATVTQKSNDGGIDGIINEDRLGLDVIYIQAKRYQATIGRVDIQNFVGALAGKQANKGVFITTSDFKKTAVEYAETVTQKVILINGARLADLMIEHDIGVSTYRTIAIKRVDSDYFEDE